MRAGEHVTPQVRLVRSIGAGGMGAVWVAEHLALKTQVAVKFILAGRENDSEARERFSREAEAAAQVKSPHVAQIFDHGVTDDGIPFIVMELLDGEDLSKYLQAHGRLGLREVSTVITQICRALARAHSKGLIHRDVKPANVYLCDVGTPERFVKLLDFGVAKVLGGESSTATKSGAITGTPVYMAPEQLLGAKDLDHRADLWSVAVVAYELIAGRRPFPEETAAAIALRLHTRGMPRASEGINDLSERSAAALDAWFEKAWSIDPKNRFDSATTLAEEFEGLVQLLHEEHGTGTMSRLVLPIPEVVRQDNRGEVTLREKPGAAVSDVTLASGRLEAAYAPAPPKSVKSLQSEVVAPMPASAPHTETPISRGLRDSHAVIAPVTETTGRAHWGAVVVLALSAVIGVVFLTRKPHPEPSTPTAPASSAQPAVKEPPSVVAPSATPTPIATPSTSAAPTVAPTPSTTTTAKKPPIAAASTKPSASVTATPTATGKKLEEIE